VSNVVDWKRGIKGQAKSLILSKTDILKCSFLIYQSSTPT